jgi:hypothetical protein
VVRETLQREPHPESAATAPAAWPALRHMDSMGAASTSSAAAAAVAISRATFPQADMPPRPGTEGAPAFTLPSVGDVASGSSLPAGPQVSGAHASIKGVSASSNVQLSAGNSQGSDGAAKGSPTGAVASVSSWTWLDELAGSWRAAEQHEIPAHHMHSMVMDGASLMGTAVGIVIGTGEDRATAQTEDAGGGRGGQGPRPPVLVFAGLRVRVGLSSGVTPADVSFNAVAGRRQFGGAALAAAKIVCDAAQGGMVLMSAPTFAQLVAHALPPGLVALHMGEYQMPASMSGGWVGLSAASLACCNRARRQVHAGAQRCSPLKHIWALPLPAP